MKRQISLKNALLMNLVLAVLIPVLVVGMVTARFLYRDLGNDIDQQNTALAVAVEAEIRDHLLEPITALRHLSRLLADEPSFLDDKRLDRLLDMQVAGSRFFESLVVLDGAGRVTHAAYPKEKPEARGNYPGMDYSAMGFYRQAKGDRNIHWSDTFISPFSNEPTISVSLPFGEGMIVGNVNLHDLSAMAARLGLNGRNYVYIVNRQGTVIAHQDKNIVRQQLNLSNLNIVHDGLQGRYGTYRYRFQGKEKEGVARTIPETGWLVVVAHDEAVAYAPVARVEKIFMLGMAATIMCCLILALWSINRILGPLHKLTVNVQKLAGGDYNLVPMSGNFSEIESLAGNVSFMAEAINVREEALMERNEELTAIEEELRQQIDEYHHSQDQLHAANLKLVDSTEKLSVSEERYRQLVETSPDGIAVHSGGKFVFVNPGFVRLFRAGSAEQLIGEPVLNFIHTDYRAVEQERISQTLAAGAGASFLEEKCIRLDGSLVDVEIADTPVMYGGCSALQVICRDITERKQVEESINRLNSQLEQRIAERTLQLEISNKELESFCYSVSHDLRAPLRHINGFSQALMEDCAIGLDAQGMNYLHRICTASTRMGQLIDELLELSRVSRHEMKREDVNLSDLSRSIMKMFRETTPERQVEFILAENLAANGDNNLLRLVLQNLLDNAWKYTSKKAVALIEFGVTTIAGESAFFVRDNGVGFDMAYAEKLFGAFQRLHGDAEFEGTGIGLATAQRIIHRHGGRIWGEGAVGNGAIFYFTLPQLPPFLDTARPVC